MRLVRWEPFQELDRLFDNGWYPNINTSIAWGLAADVFEQNGNVTVKMQLPGVDPEKVDITFENDHHLRISGSREEKQETEEKNYYSREIRRGSFERLIRLPAPVDQSKSQASFENGILIVTTPKKTKETQNKVKIKVAGKDKSKEK